MNAEQAKARLLAVEKELGHAVRVFTNTASSVNLDEISSSSTEEPDKFYEFTPDDYYRIMSDRIGAQSQILKTHKMREAEEAARRAKVTKKIGMSFTRKYLSGHDKWKQEKKLKNLLSLKERQLTNLLSKNWEIHHLKIWVMKRKKKYCNELHEGLAVENDVEEDMNEIEGNQSGDGLDFENNYSHSDDDVINAVNEEPSSSISLDIFYHRNWRI